METSEFNYKSHSHTCLVSSQSDRHSFFGFSKINAMTAYDYTQHYIAPMNFLGDLVQKMGVALKCTVHITYN